MWHPAGLSALNEMKIVTNGKSINVKSRDWGLDKAGDSFWIAFKVHPESIKWDVDIKTISTYWKRMWNARVS